MSPALAQLLAQPNLRTLALVALAIAVLIVRRASARRYVGRHLRQPLALIAIGLFFAAVDSGVRTSQLGIVVPYLDAIALGSFAIGVVRALLTLFVDLYLRRHSGAAISAIFRDITSIVVYFLVVLVVLRTTLDINLASLITTSAILTAIIGLALQDVLGNVLSGLVLEVEQSFAPGDWVRVGSFEGVVEETGWRTTKIRTRVNEIISLPNAMLSKEPLVNYSRPDPRFGDTIRFEAGYEIPPSLVQDTVAEVFGSDPAVLTEPALEVRFERWAEYGAAYAVRYWITDFKDLERIRSRINSKLWYALRRADIRVPYPARDVFFYQGDAMKAVVPPDVFEILRAIPLLAPLTDPELSKLCRAARRSQFGRSELVVRRGEPGDSFYVIESGSAEVVLGEEGDAHVVAALSKGAFFGEMSLLAGEPRNATVRASSDLSVVTIDRAAFKEIIVADPTLIEQLSAIVTRRQAELTAERERMSAAGPVDHERHAHNLSERIRAFFGLP